MPLLFMSNEAGWGRIWLNGHGASLSWFVAQ